MNVLLMLISYLIGSINFAYLVSKFKGINIQDLGSGNPGSSNVLRTMGKKYAIFVLVMFVLASVFRLFTPQNKHLYVVIQQRK